jgi:transcriptional regulator with XRE-family HTH domain
MNNRVKELREDHDYTQQQLAERIGITQRKYSYLETGTQPLTADFLVALADIYNVSIDYILLCTDTPQRYPPRDRNR